MTVHKKCDCKKEVILFGQFRFSFVDGESWRPANGDSLSHRLKNGTHASVPQSSEDPFKISTNPFLIFDLHTLLDALADTKVHLLGLARGREASERERAQILSGYRRTLSTTAARASSGCLLGRLAKVGEVHRAAAKRRAWAKREGERLEEERRAHWRAHVQG